MKRFWLYNQTSESDWTSWKWQLKNRLQNTSRISDYFPNLPGEEIASFDRYVRSYSLGLTPYILTLIELDEIGNPRPDDPVWNQFRFLAGNEMDGKNDYNGRAENWENPEELPTKILHHKYPDRAIIRVTNQCFGHCNYCYLTARILDLESSQNRKGDQRAWEESLEYLKAHSTIRDVLISGGDPLTLSNQRIEGLLRDLTQIPSIRSIRLNTRVLTFNPYRIDDELVTIIKKYRLTAMEIHLAHPREITGSFDHALERFDTYGYRPLFLWRAPLLHGINDFYETLEDLLMKLYERRIIPYYLFHYAPFTLGRSKYGVSIKDGCKLLAQLRRAIPGPAFPKYTLFHKEGKQDIPLENEGTPEFQYTFDEEGQPVVKFKNWKGNWVSYPDIAT